MHSSFNTQPPEGGWPNIKSAGKYESYVSTHSRPKAAGKVRIMFYISEEVSTHSRPKAAGIAKNAMQYYLNSFNTQPPEGGWPTGQQNQNQNQEFQHTAARRRLALLDKSNKCNGVVSTHSRPKAAGPLHWLELRGFTSFNTQPPEGGWYLPSSPFLLRPSFNTQPPEGGW